MNEYCQNGHRLTEATIVWTSQGRMVCRRCRADKERLKYHTNPEFREKKMVENKARSRRKRLDEMKGLVKC